MAVAAAAIFTVGAIGASIFGGRNAASAARAQARAQERQNKHEFAMATLQAQTWLSVQLKGFSTEIKLARINADTLLQQASYAHDERMAQIKNDTLALKLESARLEKEGMTFETGSFMA